MGERAEDPAIDELLVEMSYAWEDIERYFLENPIMDPMDGALTKAFRVEARLDHNDFGDPITVYEILFDGDDAEARKVARSVRDSASALKSAIERHVQLWDRRYSHDVRVVPTSASVRGVVCGRPNQPPSQQHLDATDVPTPKPRSNVPLIEKDGYWLTPIEVPFYDALRETGAIFAVQPWVQGVETRFRPDFIVFYDGGTVVVELDGHESHKTREQRTRDAKRQRWFEARGIRVLRWTGSEVHANAQECVRELLDIVRGRQARF